MQKEPWMFLQVATSVEKETKAASLKEDEVHHQKEWRSEGRQGSAKPGDPPPLFKATASPAASQLSSQSSSSPKKSSRAHPQQKSDAKHPPVFEKMAQEETLVHESPDGQPTKGEQTWSNSSISASYKDESFSSEQKNSTIILGEAQALSSEQSSDGGILAEPPQQLSGIGVGQQNATILVAPPQQLFGTEVDASVSVSPSSPALWSSSEQTNDTMVLAALPEVSGIEVSGEEASKLESTFPGPPALDGSSLLSSLVASYSLLPNPQQSFPGLPSNILAPRFLSLAALFAGLLLLLVTWRVVTYFREHRASKDPVRRFVEGLKVLKPEQLQLAVLSSGRDPTVPVLLSSSQPSPAPLLSAWWKGTVVRVEGRVAKGAGGFEALVSPLGRRCCVQFSSSVSQPRTDGIHPLPLAFHTICLDFRIELMTTKPRLGQSGKKDQENSTAPTNLLIRGPDTSLFDMWSGNLTTNTTSCIFDDAPEHWQAFVKDHPAPGTGSLLEIDYHARKTVGLEFQEVALEVGALVTCVGELCVADDGSLGLAPYTARDTDTARDTGPVATTATATNSSGHGYRREKTTSGFAKWSRWLLPGWGALWGESRKTLSGDKTDTTPTLTPWNSTSKTTNRDGSAARGEKEGDPGEPEHFIASSFSCPLPQKVMISDDPKLLNKGGVRQKIQRGSEVLSAIFQSPQGGTREPREPCLPDKAESISI